MPQISLPIQYKDTEEEVEEACKPQHFCTDPRTQHHPQLPAISPFCMRGLIRPPLVPLKPNYMPHCQAAGHQITSASVPKMALMPMWTCSIQQHSNKVYILGINSEYTPYTDSHCGSYMYASLFECEWLKITLSNKISLYVCILNRL